MSESPDLIHVLHVDDDPDFADLTATFLEQEDDRFDVETATTADEALDLLADGAFDCVVSDYDMPGQNGIQFLETIREDYPDLPFIVFTGKGSEEVASEAISAGVSDYLQKQAGADQYTILANRITNLVSQYRAVATVEEYASQRQESERYRRQFLAIISDPNLSEDTKIDRALALGCERLGVENGHLVVIDQETDRHEVVSASGSDIVREGVTDLSSTYCRKTIESDEILDVYHASEQGWGDDPAYEEFGLECYIGGKLTADSRLFGTLCFVDTEPREPFTAHEKAFFDLLVQWFGQLLERRRRLNQADTIFEHTQDGLFLIDVSDDGEFTVRAVNQSYEELTGLATADIKGQTPRELLGDEQGAQVEAHYRECVEKREPIEYDEQLTLGETTTYWHTRLAPVIEDGRVVQLVGSTRDITDQRERQRRYDAIFNHTYQFTGLLEPDGTLIEANETVLEFGGLDLDDVLGKKLWDTYWFQHSEKTRDRVREAVTRAADGEFVRHELHIQGADREAIIDFSVRPLRDDQGAITLLVPEGRDITEMTQREQAITDLHRTVRELLDAETPELIAERLIDAMDDILDLSTCGIWFHDESEQVLRPVAWSDRSAELIGHPPTFHPGESLAWEVFETGEVRHYDDVSTVAGRHNPETPVRSEILIPFDDHGVVGIGSAEVGAFDEIDVTLAQMATAHAATALDRLARERELEIKNRRLDAILDNTTTPMFMKDAEGRYVFVNHGYRELFDLHDEPVVGRTDHDLHPSDIATAVRENDRTVIERGEPLETEERVLVDGEERLFLSSKVPIYDTGEYADPDEPVAVFGVASDITELRRREAQLQRERDRLDEFASVMSHDIRNPLSIAAGRLEFVREECDSEHIDSIDQALTRMDTLIDDLLTLAREGDRVGETEPVDLAELSEACWRNVETADATVRVSVDRTIHADRSRLAQLLENLIRNAVEHGGEEVAITVGALDDGFYVEDDGPGIPQDERDDVFTAGYSTAEDGTGFGLSIVKQIADAHGWSVRVTDGADGGARFEITGMEFAE